MSTDAMQPADETAGANDGWQALPRRGAKYEALWTALGLALPAAGLSVPLALGTRLASPLWLAPAAALLGAAFGARLGWKRHRRTRWTLDEDGFALQRGRLWQTETRVPASRVQHLDLKRGPLERLSNLATLVVHTAGTRMAAVSVSGLDDADAEALRDRLARQLEQDGDAL